MNKIDLDGWLDEKLARGMSREIFRNTSKAWDRFTLNQKGSARRIEGRAKIIREIKQFMQREKIYLGLNRDEELYQFAFGTVFADFIQPEWQALSIEEMQFNLLADNIYDALRFKRICVIDVHAVRRLIERTGVHGQDAVLKAFLPAIQWCQALRHGCRPRAALLPLGEHLVAVKGTKLQDGYLTPRIVTFLDRRNMTDANIAIRKKLEPLAQWRPEFPSYHDLPMKAEELVKIAWSCGAEWEERASARAEKAAMWGGDAKVPEPLRR